MNNSDEVLSKSNLICKVSFPTEKEFSLIKDNSYLIVSNYNPEKDKKFVNNKIKIFALNLLPTNYKSSIYGCAFFSSKFSWLQICN